MSWLAALLGHPQVKDVVINNLGEEAKVQVILINDTTLDVELMGGVGIGIPQPTGGNRIYNGSERSFDFCFKSYLSEGK